MITATLISSCHWKTLVPFYLRKKRPENAFLTLIVNYHKIVQKNKLCHPKQQQIGYLMIYEVIYLLLVLIEKLAFSSVVRVYYILKQYNLTLIRLQMHDCWCKVDLLKWKHHGPNRKVSFRLPLEYSLKWWKTIFKCSRKIISK